MWLCFNFLRKKNYVHKINSRHILKFHIKTYLESFVSICHLYHLLKIIYKSVFYNLNITLNYRFISKTIISNGLDRFISKTRGKFIWECPWSPWQPCSLSFSFFLVMPTLKVTSCIFVLKCFNCSNSSIHVPFLLCYRIRRHNQMEIVNRWIAIMAEISVQTMWPS